MNRTLALVSLLLGCSGVSPVDPWRDAGRAEPPPDAGQPPDAGHVPRVLFIGNSYTYVNDLPAVVKALGAELEVETVAVGGARLREHWESTGARDRLEHGGFDVVVLQGQSLEPLVEPDDFTWYGDRLAGAAFDAGTRVVWFATWARRTGDAVYTDPAAGVRSPDEMAQRLYARYAFAARLSGGSVARVGEAWRFADEAALYADDGSHPGPEGTLLSACVLTPAVTGDAAKVPGVPPLGLSSERAGELCALATGIACPYSPTATVCGFACVETDTDAENCGGCRVRCAPAQQCSAGHCR